ncbi:serine/threonine-protein kinase AFC3-like isoform X1 [Papaver somniferum]|uniref:serine/threonine-protein kinase AFC3-like isoform X1 n=2 Tax=Papaver somniferum TaxID=3469 RepID=UPI000E7053A6|nr:serine/threonine-protein kinase AFC3-like isoform X1 [Papaver somniferum]
MENQRTRKRPRLSWDVAPTEPEAFRLPRVSNEVSYRHASPPRRDDDREGHYVFNYGDNLTQRYNIISKMGEGTFGRVLECWDREEKRMVAIKVVRSIRKYRDAAMIEIDVLQLLAKHELGRSRCVQIHNWFDYRNHVCIVFEKLGPSLFDFLRRNKYCSLPVDLVREFGRQLLESVAYMHDLHMIHTDLKPENILLVSSESVKLPSSKRNSRGETQFRCLPKSSSIKLIDFGSTVFDDKEHTSIVSTRHYRAPEVILGLGWSFPCDLWSIGCILVELCSGNALFQTHENLEHLAMMERVFGPLPEHMARKADRGAEKYFRTSRRGTRLNWPEGAVSRESIRAVKKLDRLEDIVSQYVDCSWKSLFTDLLHRLLEYSPAERLTARQALDHPFFRDHIINR